MASLRPRYSEKPGEPHSIPDDKYSKAVKKVKPPSLLCLACLGVATLLTFVIVSRTAAPSNRGVINAPPVQLSSVGNEAKRYFEGRKAIVANQLSEAIRWKTISVENPKVGSKWTS